MLGAIYGDIAGSMYEPGTIYWLNRDIPYGFKTFGPSCHITDDSLMTLAVAKALVETKEDRKDYKRALVSSMLDIARRYPRVAYGENFKRWLFDSGDNPSPLNSYGNGAAMRISPVGWVAGSLEEAIRLSRLTTEVSHNHPEGIKGAEAVAILIYLARSGFPKEALRKKAIEYYPEIEGMSVDFLIASNYGDIESRSWISCQGSVPQAICAFLESSSLEEAVRNAIRLNADADTQAAIAGSIAEAYYGISEEEKRKIMSYLSPELEEICLLFEGIKRKRVGNPR